MLTFYLLAVILIYTRKSRKNMYLTKEQGEKPYSCATVKPPNERISQVLRKKDGIRSLIHLIIVVRSVIIITDFFNFIGQGLCSL